MKVRRHIVKKIFKEECIRFLERWKSSPLGGIKRILDANKIEYELNGDELIVTVSESRKILIKEIKTC